VRHVSSTNVCRGLGSIIDGGGFSRLRAAVLGRELLGRATSGGRRVDWRAEACRHAGVDAVSGYRQALALMFHEVKKTRPGANSLFCGGASRGLVKKLKQDKTIVLFPSNTLSI
jgi:hypothetical protein